MDVSRYYQLLNALLNRPEAAEYAPITVNRLRARRSVHRRTRSRR